MANKATYLSDLAALSYIQEVGDSTLKQNFTDVDMKVYEVRLLEKVGTKKAKAYNHSYGVYNEGGGQETAFDYGRKRTPQFEENDTVKNAVSVYLDGLTSVYAYRVLDYNRDQNWAKAFVMEFVTDHIEEKYYLVYKDNGDFTHLVISNA